MGSIAKLVRGTYSLDLNSGPYSLPLDFAPPAISEMAQIGLGTSANKYGGGKLVDSRLLPRDYSFDVDVEGLSNAQCEQAVDRLDAFLRSGTESEPVYFIWKPDNNISIDPSWGQFGAARRCKVLHGHCEKSGELYGLEENRKKWIFAEVNLKINPPEGLRQRVGSATGGILEDIWSSPDGISRGLMIPEATTTKITNPVFGNADWDLNWITGAGLISAQNIDPIYCLTGLSSSANLTAISATNNTFLISINAGNTNKHSFSIYVMMPDKSAPTSSIIQVGVNGSYYSPTFQNLGDGLYCAYYDNFDGIASALNFGLKITNGYTVYLLGVQLEEKAYHTPLCYGDLMGCSWTSTVHASTSSRTAARLKVAIADTGLSAGEGSIVVVVRLDATQAHPNDMMIFDLRDGSNTNALVSKYDSADDKFKFIYNNGSNAIATAAQTFAAGSIFVIHFTWGNGVMGLYVNGVMIDDDYAYTPKSLGANLWIGSNYSSTSQLVGSLLGFHNFKLKLSTTEVANDYANILQHISSGDGLGQRLESIPWIFSIDGDETMENFCDATHRDWCVAGGIPGSLPADTIFELENSVTGRSIIIGNHNAPIFVNPANYFLDLSGTAEATALGDQVEQSSIGVSEYYSGYIEITSKYIYDFPIRLFASIWDAGLNLEIATWVVLGSPTGIHYDSDWISANAASSLKQFTTAGCLIITDFKQDMNGSPQNQFTLD